MEFSELGLTAARGVLVYALLLLVVRLSGKREMGNFGPFDLIVALMLGEVVDEIIYGDVLLSEGVLAIGVIGAAQFATSWLTFASPKMNRLLEGEPTLVVRDGQLQRQGMKQERISEGEIMALLREEGIDDLRQVKFAFVEVDGHLSIIQQDWAQALTKGDLHGKPPTAETPPAPHQDTTSAIALRGEA